MSRSSTARLRGMLPTLILSILTLSGWPVFGDEEKVAPDQFVLEVDVPDGTQLIVQNKVRGAKRRFVWDVPAGKTYGTTIEARFPDGGSAARQLLLQGGYKVHLPLRSPSREAPELALQTGHSSTVSALDVSDDGAMLVTASNDYTVRLWDAETGIELRVLIGHQNSVMGVVFVPGQKVLYSLDYLGVVRKWNAVTGECVQKFQVAPMQMSLAISPDGELLATTGFPADEQRPGVSLWSTTSGKLVHFMRGRARSIALVRFSTDSRRLLSGDLGGELCLWDIATGRIVRAMNTGSESIDDVRLSPDGTVCLAITRATRFNFEGRVDGPNPDAVLTLWAADHGKLLRTIKGAVAAEFAPGGEGLFIASSDGTVELTDVTTGATLQRLKGRQINPARLAISRDGRRLASAGDGEPLVWDLSAGMPPLHLPVNSRGIIGVRHMSRERQFFVRTVFGEQLICDFPTGQPAALVSISDPVSDISPDGTRLLVENSTSDELPEHIRVNGFDVLHAETSEVLRRFAVTAACFSPDGRQMATSDSKTMKIWNAADYSVERSFSIQRWETLRSWPASGKIVTDVGIRDPNTGRLLRKIDHDQPETLAPDGRLAFMYAGPNRSRLVNVLTGDTVHHFGEVYSYGRFSRDGRLVLGYKGPIDVRSAATGRLLRKIEAGGTYSTGVTSGGMGSVDFLDDGRLIISTSTDHCISVSDFLTGDLLLRIILLGGLDWLAVTPDGLFDGSPGGRERVMFRVGGGLTLVPVDRFYQDFHYPGLIEAIWRGERPMPSADFSEIAANKPPTLEITAPQQGGEVDAGR